MLSLSPLRSFASLPLWLDHVPFPGVRKSVSDQISVFAHPNESNKWVDKDLSRFYDTSVGRRIAQRRSRCAVTGICPIRFSACFEYIYTCSRLFMFTLSSHILRSLGRHHCYLSHAFLSHPALASLRLRVVFFLQALRQAGNGRSLLETNTVALFDLIVTCPTQPILLPLCLMLGRTRCQAPLQHLHLRRGCLIPQLSPLHCQVFRQVPLGHLTLLACSHLPN
jgi:hypothetical protein